MSDKIKPSEVSQVLLEQLNGLSNSAQFDEVGTVLQVSDGVARIYGLRNAEANELLEFGHQGGYGREAYQAHCLYPRERQYAGPRHQPTGSGHRRQGRDRPERLVRDAPGP